MCFDSTTTTADNSQTTTTSTDLPDWLQEPVQRGVDAADTLGQDYQFRRYDPSRRVAPLGFSFQEAKSDIWGNQGAWQPGFDEAGGILDGLTPTEPRTNIEARQFTDADINAYMNPYIQSVVADTMAEMDRGAQIRRNELQGAMAREGAFGTSQAGVALAEQDRNYMDVRAREANRGFAEAFQQAAGLFTADADRALRGDMADAEFGLAHDASQRALANDMANLGRARSQMGYADAAAKMDVASVEQRQEQALRDADWSEFLREQEEPWDMLARRIAILTGVPFPQSQTTTSSGSQEVPGPSPFAQAAGAVGSILGGIGSIF